MLPYILRRLLSAIPTLDAPARRTSAVADTDAEAVTDDADLDGDAAEDIDLELDEPEIADTGEE